ncbi:hypothetical protein DSO57_1001425 [Entomophthora muscae]|uniref:Uncharacterized protein n=1 Tax=Entomophthora muscae TaxID=34485 RepID=A0ACC2TKQ7_9FUNG|nr:hypothetical protein DSO57_1001425 [Entomophthora muscae]
MQPKANGAMVVALKELFLLQGVAALAHSEREKQTDRYISKVSSHIKPKYVRHAANVLSEGWVMPDIIPELKKPAVWYFDPPPKPHLNILGKKECTNYNATIRRCYQKYAAGYYWGKHIPISRTIHCPTERCQVTVTRALHLVSFKVEETPKSNRLSFNPKLDAATLPPGIVAANLTTSLHVQVTVSRNSPVFIWAKPLYWAQAVWFNESEYFDARSKTRISQTNHILPISSRGNPFLAIGVANASFSTPNITAPTITAIEYLH